MKAEERRKQILEFFRGQSGPVSASALADRFSVSRQIIVGDVALLRASGMNIEATPRGYILTEEQKKGILRRVACAHNREQMEDELNICVDYGCEVLNVIVEHPVYGQLTGQLVRLETALNALNPARQLERGYALVFDAATRKPVTTARQPSGKTLNLRFSDGELAVKTQ